MLTCLLLVAAAAAPSEPAPAAGAATVRVAVQPFENLSSRPEDGWMGPVAADAVGEQLASCGGLAVLDRRQMGALLRELAAAQLVGDDKAGAALAGADTLVVGSVAVVPPETVRITARVIDVQGGRLRTSLTEDARPAELLARLQSLAARVAVALGAAVRPRPPPMSTDAFREYSAGLDALFEWRLDEAEKRLERAAALAPGHPLVESGLANLLVTRVTNRKAARDTLYAAIGYATLAAAEDPESGEPLWAIGRAYNALGKPSLALEALRAAVARQPGRALFHVSLGWALTRAGDFPAACAAYADAARLAPGIDLPFFNHATNLAYAGRFDAALAAYDRAAATFKVPDWVLGDLEDGVEWHRRPELHALRAVLLAWQGKPKPAQAALDAARAGGAAEPALAAAQQALSAGARAPARGPGAFAPDACAPLQTR